VILIFGKRNIFAAWFLIIIIGTPCTTNFIAFTFNQTINCKNYLMVGCLMDVNLRVVKLASLIDFSHATSMLATQH
jgi:hypothetical protein